MHAVDTFALGLRYRGMELRRLWAREQLPSNQRARNRLGEFGLACLDNCSNSWRVREIAHPELSLLVQESSQFIDVYGMTHAFECEVRQAQDRAPRIAIQQDVRKDFEIRLPGSAVIENHNVHAREQMKCSVGTD